MNEFKVNDKGKSFVTTINNVDISNNFRNFKLIFSDLSVAVLVVVFVNF